MLPPVGGAGGPVAAQEGRASLLARSLALWPLRRREGEGGGGRRQYPCRDANVRAEATDYSNTFCPNAAWAESRTFFVPVHPTYEEQDMHDIAAAIKKVGRAYLK